ncbi:MAG: leucine-rich repeat protein [Paludibacteraceae bacterium]|nr:leucine-rich repeat protein [Paludibacteraceae bacterium]
MRKLFTLLIAVFAAIGLLAQTSGTCGDNLNWSYNETTKTLTITGSGAMTDYAAAADRPWHTFRADVESIVVPDGLTNIGAYAFQGCKMVNFTIPESVTSIGKYAFYYCTALTAIDIPAGVTSMGNFAFNACSALVSVNLHEGLTSIGVAAFSGCKALTTINLPTGVTSLGEDVFWGCSALTNITIPGTLSTIPARAFGNDTLLTTVVLSEGVTTIQYNAFYKCKRLSSINIPESVTSVVGGAFNETNHAIAEPLYNSHLFVYLPKSYEGEYVVPNGISVIAGDAFRDCANLTSVILPADIDSIGTGAFAVNPSLKYLTLLTPIPPKHHDYVFSSEYMPKMVFVPSAEAYKAYTGDSFWNSASYRVGYNSNGICYTLNHEAHTAKVDYLSASATEQADYVIGAIEIPSALNIYGTTYTVNAIGKAAFYGCTGLTEITLPATIDTLYAQCFKNCSSLTKITMLADHPAILQHDNGYEEYFDGTNSNLMFYVPAANFNAYKQSAQWVARTIVQDKIRPIEDVELFTVTFYHRSKDYGANYTGDGTEIRFNSVHAGYAAQKVVAGQPAIEPEPLYPVADANYPWGPIPTGYSYAGWEEDFSHVTGNMKIHTRYVANPYTVTFKNYNDTVLEEALFEYGTVPFYSKGTPHRDTDAEFSYIFVGWFSSATAQTVQVLPEVTGNVTYTAVYSKVDRQYTITFEDGNGNVLQQSEWQKNVMPVYSGATPTKEGLEFYGWSPELKPATADATYTPVFRARIIFNDEWGHEWQNSLWELGATPVYSGETPYKDADAQYTYTFSEWPTISPATTGTTYTAVFDKTLRKYRIAFFNGEQLLQDEQLDYGTMPEYKGEDLTYTAEGVKYNHVGWTPELHAVTGEQFYYARFEEVPRFIVVFVDWDDSVLKEAQTVNYGEAAIAPADPVREGYTFTGWDKDFSAVTEDMTIKAQYEQAEGLEDIPGGNVQCTKVLIDGVLFIIRPDGKVYTAQGAEVR